MTRAFLPALFALASLVAFPDPALRAQSVQFGVGGGLLIPSGNYSTSDKDGWHLLAKAEVGIPVSPIAIRVDGLYGQTTRRSGVSGSTTLAGGTADVVYQLGAPMLPTRLYFIAGVGYYNVKSESSTSSTSEAKVAFGGGVGISVGLGATKFFGEGRAMSVTTSGASTTFLTLSAGLLFGL